MKAYLGKLANNSYVLSLKDNWSGSIDGFSHSIKMPRVKTIPELKKGDCIQVCLFVDSEIVKMEESE